MYSTGICDVTKSTVASRQYQWEKTHCSPDWQVVWDKYVVKSMQIVEEDHKITRLTVAQEDCELLEMEKKKHIGLFNVVR